VASAIFPPLCWPGFAVNTATDTLVRIIAEAETDFGIGDIGHMARYGLNTGDTRIVHHDVKAAEFFLGVVNGSIDLIPLRHVGFESGCFAAESAQFSSRPTDVSGC